jgi:hypothetical protein
VAKTLHTHGSRQPEELPAYTAVRAAQIVRLSPSTLRLWACGDGEHKALFRPAEPTPLTLSFNNLVESFVLASMRRVHGVSMQKVRKALRFIGDKLRVERPLIHARFRTDGVRLFVQEADRLLDRRRVRVGKRFHRGSPDALSFRAPSMRLRLVTQRSLPPKPPGRLE